MQRHASLGELVNISLDYHIKQDALSVLTKLSLTEQNRASYQFLVENIQTMSLSSMIDKNDVFLFRFFLEFLSTLPNARAAINEHISCVTTGDTLLTYAVRQNRPQMVEILLLSGLVDANQPTKDLDTALILAVSSKKTSIADKLRLVSILSQFNNIDPNIYDAKQKTALMYAVKQSPELVLGLGLIRGIDPNKVDRRGYCAFRIAINVRNEAAALAVLHVPGFNYHAENDIGETPLFHAANVNSVPLVRAILRAVVLQYQAGGNLPKIINNQGKFIYDYILHNRYGLTEQSIEILDLLTKDLHALPLKMFYKILKVTAAKREKIADSPSALLDRIIAYHHRIFIQSDFDFYACDQSGMSLMGLATKRKNAYLRSLMAQRSERKSLFEDMASDISVESDIENQQMLALAVRLDLELKATPNLPLVSSVINLIRIQSGNGKPLLPLVVGKLSDSVAKPNIIKAHREVVGRYPKRSAGCYPGHFSRQVSVPARTPLASQLVDNERLPTSQDKNDSLKMLYQVARDEEHQSEVSLPVSKRRHSK